MQIKTSIRLYGQKPVRALWDKDNNCWLYSAVDIISVLTNAKNPRKYWNDFKNRKPKIKFYVSSHKLLAADNKHYNNDMTNDLGINVLLETLPSQNKEAFVKWLKGLSSPDDEQSKQRAYSLWKSDLLKDSKPGTIKSLQQIHAYLFGGIYTFAGQIRTKNIRKGSTTFANANYFDIILPNIENMPQSNIDQIIDKYIEMNIAHPFMEGNGRATRIWLDLILKKELKLCVDWSKIDKQDYLNAMTISPINPTPIIKLLKSALTNKINDRQIYMKGIDTSYFYEQIED